jgi:hypothetical protein
MHAYTEVCKGTVIHATRSSKGKRFVIKHSGLAEEASELVIGRDDVPHNLS